MKMEDIARLAGVSRQTVSAVMNGKSWVTEATRRRVMEVVEAHNYAPNQHAVSLVGGSSSLIGVVLRDIGNPFYSQVALGIESVARAKGYSLLYYNTFESHATEVSAIQSALAYNVAGVIISPVLVGVDLKHLWDFRQRGKVLVSLDQIPGMQTHYVAFTNEEAAYEATQYLVGLGHKRIGYLGGPESSASNQARLMGFKRCLVDKGMSPDSAVIVGNATTPEDRNRAAHEVLSMEKSKRPTAVLCFNDLLAISVYKSAHDLGMRIPDDISVVGMDDIEMAELLGPPLTTMRLHAREAGAAAAELAIEAIASSDPQKAPKQRIFEPKLIERGSVKKAGK